MKKKGLWLTFLSLFMTSCSAHIYNINIEKNLNSYHEVLSVASYVDHDFPPNYLSDAEQFENFVFMSAFICEQPFEITADQSEKYSDISKRISSQLRSSVIAKAFTTNYQGEIAFHEVTAGLLDIPFAELLTSFDPAQNWGKNLSGYLGGELRADLVNDAGQTELQRERMVLSPPWYALGAPDLDMSKYEMVQYSDNSVKIIWKVTKSENSSVFLDIGYLQFRKYLPENTKNQAGKTLVVFNSIHRVEAGFMGKILPESIKLRLTLKSLRDLFAGHVKQYQKIISQEQGAR
jgi:hypothetical protein